MRGEQGLAELGEIARGGHVGPLAGGRRQAVGRLELRDRRQAEFARLLVHQLDEAFAAAADVLGQGHGRVVGGLHHQGVEQFFQRKRLARIEPHLRAAHVEGFLRHRDGLVEAQLAGLDAVEDHEQVHQLEHAGRIAGAVRAVLEQHAAVAGVHHDGAVVGIARDRLPPNRRNRRADQRQENEDFLHAELLAGAPRKCKRQPRRRGMKKDAAKPQRPGEATASYLATALTRAAALSVCSQVKNLKFLSPALRPKWPYWSVRE